MRTKTNFTPKPKRKSQRLLNFSLFERPAYCETETISEKIKLYCSFIRLHFWQTNINDSKEAKLKKLK